MMNPKHYTYRVMWSEEDQEYVALCAEFPSLSYLAKHRTKALEGITEVVSSVIKDLKSEGEPVPEPLSDKAYSGRFVVRLLPEHHRLLAIKAAEAGASLNRYVSSRLV